MGAYHLDILSRLKVRVIPGDAFVSADGLSEPSASGRNRRRASGRWIADTRRRGLCVGEVAMANMSDARSSGLVELRTDDGCGYVREEFIIVQSSQRTGLKHVRICYWLMWVCINYGNQDFV